MSESILVDTNVLVYAVDVREGTRTERAIAVVRRLVESRAAATTPQIVMEFYSATTRARHGRTVLSPPAARRWLEGWIEVVRFLPLDERVSREAVRGAHEHGMSIFDAQVWASAKVHGVGAVLTEDTRERERVEGVRFVNPFARAFDPETFVSD